jgi:hypothetical protein
MKIPSPDKRGRGPCQGTPPRSVSNHHSAEQPQDNPAARQIPPWLVERLSEHRQRKEQRRAERAEFAQARNHGLAARHRVKVRRQGGGGR